jgi:hypothetical protein
MVASVTDSPSVGTRISVMVLSSKGIAGAVLKVMCHRPRMRATQYAEALVIETNAAAY